MRAAIHVLAYVLATSLVCVVLSGLAYVLGIGWCFLAGESEFWSLHGRAVAVGFAGIVNVSLLPSAILTALRAARGVAVAP